MEDDSGSGFAPDVGQAPAGFPPGGPSSPGQYGQYDPYGGYGQYGTPPRKSSGWKTPLIIILSVIVLVIIVGFAACASACISCGEAIHEATKNSVHSGQWGWEKGQGPSPQGDIYHLSTKPEPRDSAAPDAAKDGLSKDNLRAIYAGLQKFKTARGDYPDDLSAASLESELASYVTPWPTNPWTGAPMAAGPHRGDFDYTRWTEGVDLTVNVAP